MYLLPTDNIPVKVLPPALQPAILILQRIVPFVGYIGAFIAWSWSALKGFDQGGINYYFRRYRQVIDD
jgi:hypothetical protein